MYIYINIHVSIFCLYTYLYATRTHICMFGRISYFVSFPSARLWLGIDTVPGNVFIFCFFSWFVSAWVDLQMSCVLLHTCTSQFLCNFSYVCLSFTRLHIIPSTCCSCQKTYLSVKSDTSTVHGDWTYSKVHRCPIVEQALGKLLQRINESETWDLGMCAESFVVKPWTLFARLITFRQRGEDLHQWHDWNKCLSVPVSSRMLSDALNRRCGKTAEALIQAARGIFWAVNDIC